MTHYEFLTPRQLESTSECREYRPRAGPRVREEWRTRTQLPDQFPAVLAGAAVALSDYAYGTVPQ
jgi:hypothetical protein